MNDSMQLLQTLTNLPLLALVLARISGLVAFAPFFSGSGIPVKARALLAGAIAIVVLPFASTQFAVPADFGSIFILMIGELVIGLALGLMISTVFSGLELAGVLIGQQVGISMAQVFDPLFEEEASVLGQLYFWLAMVIFLLIRGHLILLGALIRSFRTLPPGKVVMDENLVGGVVGVLKLAFILALQVSAPVLVAIFLTTLALGFVGRTVPQLNIMTVGFSLRVVLGFILIVFCILPAIQAFFNALEKTFGSLYGFLGF